MPWARASALERHLECPGASWLPRLDRGVWRPGYLQTGVVELPPVPDELPNTSAADHGTAMHEAKAGTGVDPFMSQVDPYREVFWPSGLGVHEQAVSYDCRTREIKLGPTNLSRAEMDAWKDSQGPDCVVGTADWWANLPSGEPWISDLKTGWRRPDVATPQTLFYLLLKCRVDGWEFGRISIDWWPKKEPEPTRDGLWRQVSGLALDAFEDDLQAAWKRAVIIPNPDSRPGPWCGYCPSWRACPKVVPAEEQQLAA
jgi:hypothetical protein